MKIIGSSKIFFEDLSTISKHAYNLELLSSALRCEQIPFKVEVKHFSDTDKNGKNEYILDHFEVVIENNWWKFCIRTTNKPCTFTTQSESILSAMSVAHKEFELVTLHPLCKDIATLYNMKQNLK